MIEYIKFQLPNYDITEIDYKKMIIFKRLQENRVVAVDPNFCFTRFCFEQAKNSYANIADTYKA